MKKSFTKLDTKARFSMLESLSQIFVNPKSELDFENPFELLCAVILSAQATDLSVNKVTPALFKKAPDPLSLSQKSQGEIEDIIKTVGLHKNKSKNLILMAKMLVDDFKGEVPESYEELIKLPGVGSKTAKVVLNVAFNKPTVAVDTHIFRVCNRTGFCTGKSVQEVENNIVPLIDQKFILKAHHLLLLHGRYVCKARKPLCNECKISALCKKINVSFDDNR